MPPKQVLEVMGFAQHEYSTGLCATGVKVIAYTSTMELVLSHHKGRCICYQYFYMIVERRTIPLRPNNNRQDELVLKKWSYANSTECIERELVALLLEAMRQYNKDNADLSSTHVKNIAHHSPVKLVLSHQESRCICYQYLSHDWRKNNHLVMT